MNNFYNLAPSLHITLRTILWPVYVTPCPRPLRYFVGFWFLLIGASTLLCWQHQLIDVLTGQLLGLFCIHLHPWDPPVRPQVERARQLNCRPDLGLRYLALCLFLLAASWLSWPLGVFLLWPALAVGIVAAAYLGAGPALLGKKNGTFPRSTRWLLAPFTVVGGAWSWRLCHDLPASRELLPGVFLGRRHTQQEALESPFESILDLTAEFPEVPAFRERHYLNIPMLDLCNPSADQLQQAVDFIGEQRALGRTVFLHCALGLGRTGQVAVAHLLSERLAESVDQAFDKVRAVQPRLIGRHRHSLHELLERLRPEARNVPK